jgi:hypothetical protein
VTRRVGKDIAAEPARSELQNPGPGVGDVVDHDVEMELLGPFGIRPSRGLVVGGSLKRDSGGLVVGGYHDPVVTVVGHRQPQKLGIESRERSRVGTVDDHVVESSNHDLDNNPVRQARGLD